jgi:hypothetical protein
MEELRGTLPPEFLNRIDEVIAFRPLSREQRGIGAGADRVNSACQRRLLIDR